MICFVWLILLVLFSFDKKKVKYSNKRQQTKQTINLRKKQHSMKKISVLLVGILMLTLSVSAQRYAIIDTKYIQIHAVGGTTDTTMIISK